MQDETVPPCMKNLRLSWGFTGSVWTTSSLRVTVYMSSVITYLLCSRDVKVFLKKCRKLSLEQKCYKVPLRASRPPRCMISKWQGGASLVHLLWHFSLSAHRANLISVCLGVAVCLLI